MKIDDWFKSTLIFLFVIFLIILYLYSQNGRYVAIKTPQGWVGEILDTRTGKTYEPVAKPPKLP